MEEQPDKQTLEARLAEERAAQARAAHTQLASATGAPADEPEDEPEDEPADEPADELAVDERSDEARAEELGLVVDAFEVALRELLGADLPLDPVPLDGAIGFMVPGALELKAHEKFRRCSVCNGHGQVLTGSLADSKQTADCPRCSGRGYLEKMEVEASDAEQGAANSSGAADPDAGYGVPKWMGDPAVGQS